MREQRHVRGHALVCLCSSRKGCRYARFRRRQRELWLLVCYLRCLGVVWATGLGIADFSDIMLLAIGLAGPRAQIHFLATGRRWRLLRSECVLQRVGNG